MKGQSTGQNDMKIPTFLVQLHSEYLVKIQHLLMFYHLLSTIPLQSYCGNTKARRIRELLAGVVGRTKSRKASSVDARASSIFSRETEHKGEKCSRPEVRVS